MPNIYFCRLCGKKIPKWNYKSAIYCDDNCRKRDYDIRKGLLPPNYMFIKFKTVLTLNKSQVVSSDEQKREPLPY